MPIWVILLSPVQEVITNQSVFLKYKYNLDCWCVCLTPYFDRSCTMWTGFWRRTETLFLQTSLWFWEHQRTNFCSSCFPAPWLKQVRYDKGLSEKYSNLKSLCHRQGHYSIAKHNGNGNFYLRQTIVNNAGFWLYYSVNVLVSPAFINVQVSGFPKDAACRHLLVPLHFKPLCAVLG